MVVEKVSTNIGAFKRCTDRHRRNDMEKRRREQKISETEIGLFESVGGYPVWLWLLPLFVLSALSGSRQLRSGEVGCLCAWVSSELRHHWQWSSPYTPLILWQSGSTRMCPLSPVHVCMCISMSTDLKMKNVCDLILKQYVSSVQRHHWTLTYYWYYSGIQKSFSFFFFCSQ